MPNPESIEIRIEGDDFASMYGRPDIPAFHDNGDGTVELRDIPNATIIGRDYAAAVEAEGGTTWSGVRLTITRDNGGMQLNTAASNGVFRWELQPAHFCDGDGWVDDGPGMYIGRLIEAGEVSAANG